MTSPASDTERVGSYISQTAAAAAILTISTSLLPIYVIEVPHPHPVSAYQAGIPSSLSNASSPIIIRHIGVAESSTDTSLNVATRWGNYVTRRITELLVGAHDFNGLKVPVDKTGRHAWDIALELFHPNTPAPSVLPSEDGDILFVWHKAGWDIEISVGSEESEVWAHNRHSGEEFSGSVEDFSTETSRALANLAVA